MSDLLTRQDMAKLFRVQPLTIYKWAKKGKIPAPFKVGTRCLWNRKAIEEFIEKKGGQDAVD